MGITVRNKPSSWYLVKVPSIKNQFLDRDRTNPMAGLVKARPKSPVALTEPGRCDSVFCVSVVLVGATGSWHANILGHSRQDHTHSI